MEINKWSIEKGSEGVKENKERLIKLDQEYLDIQAEIANFSEIIEEKKKRLVELGKERLKLTNESGNKEIKPGVVLQENKIENYETIGYADVILEGKIEKGWISSSPRDDTVFEILKDSNGNIKLRVYKGAIKRVLHNPDHAHGTIIDRGMGQNRTNIRTELGVLTKDSEGGYLVVKKPIVHFTDESFEE